MADKIDYAKLEKLTYRGRIYYVIAKEANELVIADVNKKEQEIHIAKDSDRYEDIISGGSLEVEGVSNIYVIDTKPAIGESDDIDDGSITDDEYSSEVDMDELYYVAADDTKGKHSTREVLLKEIKSRPDGIIPFMYLLLCYAYRNITKHHYNAYECGVDFKKGDYKLEEANLDNFHKFRELLESATKEEAPAFDEFIPLLPKVGKFHIITGLGGFDFIDSFNLTKKDCIMLVDELEEFLEGSSDANAEELEDFE